MESLAATPAGVNRFQYAACKWVAERIRERQGLAMLCHPYWVTGNRNNVDESLLDHLFETQVFDALELISGDSRESMMANDINALQVARYAEERAKGRRVAVCGISDTHGVERSDAFGRFFTVCFAPSPDLPDLIAAIRDLRSVAVECPGGAIQRAYGPYRLVRYTDFLLREVFPQHDELCFDEGRFMIQHASGDASAAAKSARFRGRRPPSLTGAGRRVRRSRVTPRLKSVVNESSFCAAQRRHLARISHQLLMSCDRSPSQFT